MAEQTDHTLENVPLFADLTDSERKKYAKRVGWRIYSPDEQIIDRQDDSCEVFFVVSGSVRIVNYSLSGREISFDDLSEGTFFGELAAIDNRPRSASVVALSECLVASMAPNAFIELVSGDPGRALTIMRRLAHVIRTSTDRIMDLSTLGANNRVHAELLRLARIGASDGGGAEISPVPIHSDIASRVSTTRETVARVISDLTRKGVLSRRGDALRVKDIGVLEDMVQEFRGV